MGCLIIHHRHHRRGERGPLGRCGSPFLSPTSQTSQSLNKPILGLCINPHDSAFQLPTQDFICFESKDPTKMYPEKMVAFFLKKDHDRLWRSDLTSITTAALIHVYIMGHAHARAHTHTYIHTLVYRVVSYSQQAGGPGWVVMPSYTPLYYLV